MDTSLRNRYAIAGVGTSARSMQTDQSLIGRAVEAASAAIADAGLARTDVDFILGYQEMDSPGPQELATYLGLPECGFYDLLSGGTSTEALVSGAIGLIESGAASVVVVFRTMCGRSGKRMGGGAGWDASAWETIVAGGRYLVPHGVFNAGQRVALLAAMHLHESGLTEEALGNVCRSFYANAQHNSTARMYGKPLTMEAYLAAPYIASPLRIHDYCVETDEANALVVCAANRLPAGARAVTVRGIVPKLATSPTFHYNRPDPTVIAGETVAHKLYAQTGIAPGDLDTAAIYDCFSWVVLRQLLAYGLTTSGAVADFVADGSLEIGGSMPCNTAGGMLSEGYTHGLNNVLELVRQLRGEYDGTSRQVDGATLGLATGWAGPSVGSAMLLERVA